MAQYADLFSADLSDSNLRGADLGGDLTVANLRRAEGVTKKQLEQAKSPVSTTMPDGSMHH